MRTSISHLPHQRIRIRLRTSPPSRGAEGVAGTTFTTTRRPAAAETISTGKCRATRSSRTTCTYRCTSQRRRRRPPSTPIWPSTTASRTSKTLMVDGHFIRVQRQRRGLPPSPPPLPPTGEMLIRYFLSSLFLESQGNWNFHHHLFPLSHRQPTHCCRPPKLFYWPSRCHHPSKLSSLHQRRPLFPPFLFPSLAVEEQEKEVTARRVKELIG